MFFVEPTVDDDRAERTMILTISRSLGAAFLLTCLLATPTGAQPLASPDTIVTTHHQIVVDGRTIAYTARAGLLPMYVNDTGDLMARMFFVSYTVDPAPGEPPRPLTFLWNGGPGANSSQVHLLGFGPKRPKTGDAYPTSPPISETELLDNQETWLPVSDLVFVDPIGTGYSRATTDEYLDILYTTRGDIEAVAEMIRLYRTRFEAWDAPLLLAGESYGTTRAMGVAEALEKRRTHVAGVVLISGDYDTGQEVPRALDQALQTSYYTATAHYHKRLPPDLQALPRDEAIRQAVEWARQTYAPALARRDSLSEAERDAVVTELGRFTGIDPRFIDRETLTIQDFPDRLLEDQGLELGRYDSRMTGPKQTDPRGWDPTKDPSLVPLLDLMQGSSRLLNRYLRDTLGFNSDLLYRGPFGEAFHPRPLGWRGDWMALAWNRASARLEEEAAQQGPPVPPSPGAEEPPLRQAMELNPNLRVMNVRGLYDASCAALDEAVARSDPRIRDRVRNRCYAGGHQLYTDLEPRRRLQEDFARFVRETIAAQASTSPGRR